MLDDSLTYFPELEKARLCLFGSSKNGFGFRDSDLDICMTLEGHENGWKEKILEQKKHSSKRIDKNTIQIQKYSFNESAQKISSLYL